MTLVLVPITIKDARAICDRLHRHAKPPHKARFAVAVAVAGADEPCGCAIIGDPVARNLDDGWTAEVLRVATNGEHNACSMLYGAAWRAARALGYKRLVTYTLASEPGTSLIAAGYRLVAEVPLRSWDRPKRPRVDKHPLQQRFRWEAQSPRPAARSRRRAASLAAGSA